MIQNAEIFIQDAEKTVKYYESKQLRASTNEICI